MNPHSINSCSVVNSDKDALDNIEEWKSMTAQQLMNKKDSIEEEILSLQKM